MAPITSYGGILTRFRCVRGPGQPPSSLIGQIQKASGDLFGISIDYSGVLEDGDGMASCSLSAVKVSDKSDASSDVLDSTTGSLLSGIANTGTTTSLTVSAADLPALGCQIGDKLVNDTKQWTTIIKKFSGVGRRTMEFDVVPVSVAPSDVWHIPAALGKVKGGVDGQQYIVNFVMTSARGYVFQDSILVSVVDACVIPTQAP